MVLDSSVVYDHRPGVRGGSRVSTTLGGYNSSRDSATGLWPGGDYVSTTLRVYKGGPGENAASLFRHNYSLLPGVGTTVPVNVMPLRPQYTGGSQGGGAGMKAHYRLTSPTSSQPPPQSTTMVGVGGTSLSSGSKSGGSRPESGRLLKSAWMSNCSWRCVCYCLTALLLAALAVILFLLVSFHSTPSNATAVYYPGQSVYGYDGRKRPETQPGGSGTDAPVGVPIRPLPESFDLGDPVVADLPPGVLSYTYFTLQKNSAVQLNLSVEPQAKMVVYGRRTLNPTPAQFDFSEIVLGEKLHSQTNTDARIKRSLSPYGYKEENLRQTILVHYLLAGRWHLGLLNDGDQVRTVRFAAALTDVGGSGEGSGTAVGDYDDYECRYDCYGKGQCKDGKCLCERGYTGLYCEETTCQVLCSGKGVFSSGRCHCDQGWKGAECDVPEKVCHPLPNCGGRGRCGADGACVCEAPWSGAACLERACPGNCSGAHGVCHRPTGVCYCAFGWRGDACQEPFTATSLCPPDALKMACSNRGTWDPILETCACDQGWTGDTCTVETCLVDCGENGRCIVGENSMRRCECAEGFAGDRCHLYACLDGCEENGICNNGTCACNKGWNGDNCQLEGCPSDCNGNGECVTVERRWICECRREFADNDCSVPIELACDDGKDNDGDGLTDCEDSECCGASVCRAHHLCHVVREPRMILLQSQPPPPQSSFFQKTRFLIEHESVQKYADVSLFNESRASVIRGRVRSPRGGVLTGVRITDTANAMYGFTLSRAGGTFDLMVNGGATVLLQLMRSPFAPVYRAVSVPWNEIVYVGDVFMVESGDATDTDAAEGETPACRAAAAGHDAAPSVLASWQTARHAGVAGRARGQLLVDSRAVYESVRVPGTGDLYLTYFSANAAGYHSNLWLHLVGTRVPPRLRLVRLTVDIEGIRFRRTLEARPNLTFEYGWDKRNVYRQKVYGLTTAKVSIGYVYAGCKVPLTEVMSVKLDGYKSTISHLGGWNLNIHHNLDINNGVLEKGDGSIVYLREEAAVLTTTMGTGVQRSLDCPECLLNPSKTTHDDELPASAQALFSPIAVAAAPDGALFVGDHELVRRIGPGGGGRVTTVLKLSQSDTAHAYHLAVHPVSGQCYISLPLRRQVWKIKEAAAGANPATNYEVVVGTGRPCLAGHKCGDGGAADAAALAFPKGIAFDVTGALYIADQRSIRVLQPSGMLTSLISPGGQHQWRPSDCLTHVNASALRLEWPTALATDTLNDQLLVLDVDSVYRVDRRTGVVRLEVGAPSHCETLRRPDNATRAPVRLRGATALAVDKQGRILVAETDEGRKHRVRAFDVNRGDMKELETLVAGRDSKCECDRRNCPCDNVGGAAVLAREALLHAPRSLAVDAAGRLHIADQGNFKIKTVAPAPTRFDAATQLYEVFSSDSNEIYCFNRFGQHVSTRDLLSDDYVYNFTYHIDTSYGHLTQVTGSGGHRLYLVRKSAAEVHVETSHGLRSTVLIDQFDKMMKSFRRPDGALDAFDYDANTELLLSRTTADDGGGARFYDYDRWGYVTRAVTPAGAVYALESRAAGDGARRRLASVTRDGRPMYEYASSANDLQVKGEDRHSVSVSDDSVHLTLAGRGRIRFDNDGHALLAGHDTAVLKEKLEWDAVEGRSAALNAKLEWRVSVRRAGADGAVTDKKKVVQVGRKPRVNGINVLTIKFDRKSKTDTILDQNGDEVLIIHYNDAGQIESWRPAAGADLASVNNSYDALGQLKETSWGGAARRRFVYDRHGRLTDSSAGRDGDLLLRNNGYASDEDVWPTTVQIPSGPEYRLTYDSGGGVRSITTPHDETHTFVAVADLGAQLRFRFVPFSASPFVVVADDDLRRPTAVVFPGGAYRLNSRYDRFGRLERQLFDGGSIDYKHDEQSNRLLRVSDGLTFDSQWVYQGDLVIETVEKRLGTNGATARFDLFYDNQLRLTQLRPNLGADASAISEPIVFEYERRSGRLSKLKNFNFQYAGPTVRIMSDNVVSEQIYGPTKLLTRSKLSIGGRKAIERTFEYDHLGRISKTKTEIGGVTTVSTCLYTVDGYLNQYNIGTKKEHRWTLHYDLDNRLTAVNDEKLELSTGGIPTTFGSVTYYTDAAGFVTRRGDDNFTYDSLGRLTRTWHKDTYDVAYAYDHLNRVISRRGASTTDHFYYALPGRPHLLTHVQRVSAAARDALAAVSTLFYDDTDRLFAAEVAGARYLVSTAADGSPEHVFTQDGGVHQTVVRDAFGGVRQDMNPAFWLPVGHRGHFQDAETAVVIAGGRPLDTLTGRWLSVSVDAVLAPLDVYEPEAVDLFSTGKAAGLVWPKDITAWLKTAGLDISSMAPLLNADATLPGSSQVDPSVFLCPAHAPVVHGTECDVARRVDQFRTIASYPRSAIVSASPYRDVGRLRWSTGPPVFGQGVTVVTSPAEDASGNPRAILYAADLVDRTHQDIMIQLLNRSQLLPVVELETAAAVGSGGPVVPFIRRHFWKEDDADGEHARNDLAAVSLAFDQGTPVSVTPGVNLTSAAGVSGQSTVEVRSDLASAVIHYGGTAAATLDELRRWTRAVVLRKLMAGERDAIRANQTTHFRWSEDEREKLRTSATPIEGVTPVLIERYRTEHAHSHLLASDPSFYELTRDA